MNEKIIEIIEKRKEANLEILDLLKELVEKNPKLRFHQLLEMLNITVLGKDKFYEESVKTLNDLKNEIKKLNESKQIDDK